ncbi:MAG: aldehyde dehydrogenase family protein [Actinobacteria bacterium]|jgi:acyl-CoA reductase-like NAD-dependent aldehyde dehydrogenase|nr:aldehyde dehydrogenase family protein [Actinomycetota bacterium]MDA2975808.1 aldehyde dehydrogenase family protein [Actinomycetota bacterium]
MNNPIEVTRTAKLFINGAFPRSESGKSYLVSDAKGNFIANVANATRKDARDAVVAAAAAQPKWAAASAYNRGQILYRIAEMLQGRSAQFEAELNAAGVKHAAAEIAQAIDRIIWYCGWSDKLAMTTGSANPVAGPYFNFSIPEPTGVIAIVIAEQPPLLSLVNQICAAIVSGNTVVALAPQSSPLTAVSFAEVLATSDLPAGVVNLLTCDSDEIAIWLATHLEVDGIDISGVTEAEFKTELEAAAAVNLKRVLRDFKDGYAAMKTWLEIKTVWHPQGF